MGMVSILSKCKLGDDISSNHAETIENSAKMCIIIYILLKK